MWQRSYNEKRRGMTENGEEEFMTIEQVMKKLQLSRSTVEREMKKSRSSGGKEGLRAMRVGQIYRIRKAWLDEFIERHSGGGEAE
jgi:excisionase family DNA binding protein